jgi:hypothetical protein
LLHLDLRGVVEAGDDWLQQRPGCGLGTGQPAGEQQRCGAEDRLGGHAG